MNALTETTEPIVTNMKTPFHQTALRRGLLLLLLACLLPALTGRAQTPQNMTYQGYLTDQNGTALGTNGPQNYDVVFRIWNQPTGGNTPLYGELQTVTVVNGYFSILLGQGTPYVNGGVTDPRPPLSTVFTTNNLASPARYIEMTIKGLASGADVTILPRLQLVSAPYAFLASAANAIVNPNSGTNVISIAGNNVTVYGSLTNSGGSIYMDNSQEIYAKNSSGTYEGVIWPRWVDNVMYINYGSAGFSIRNNNSTPTMWMGNNGSVGIGNASPTELLQLGSFGAGDTYMAIKTGGGNLWRSGIKLRHFSDTGGFNIEDDERGGTNGLHIISYPYTATPVEAMFIDRFSGNVGLNTTTPQRRLTVNGPSLTPTSDSTYQMGVGTGASQLIMGFDTAHSAGVISASVLNTVWQNVLIAPNGGSVGIGTVSPGYLLDVNGSFHASGGAALSGYTTICPSLDNSQGNVGMGVGGYSNCKLRVGTTEQYGIIVDAGPSISAYFGGNVQVAGTLSKGGGSFKIDHPLDPENKWLYHSFVESPDMMNVYNGNTVTDEKGDATIILPSYFQALNKDFRYQLTVIGQFAQAMVSSEVSSNSIGVNFGIKTDKPNVKVSWQVTGIRQDAFANAHRIIPEVTKVNDEIGTYLYPAEHGKPESRRMNLAKPKPAK